MATHPHAARPRHVAVTTRIGRLLVREHCSFFWAEVPFRRIVVREEEHCPACVEALRAETEAAGLAFDYDVVDARTFEVLNGMPTLALRRNARVRCVIPVQVQESPGIREWAVCRSLSRGGLLVQGPRLPQGEQLEVAMFVPGLDEVRAIGRVAYSVNDPEGAANGIVFTQLDPRIANGIDAFVKERAQWNRIDPG